MMLVSRGISLLDPVSLMRMKSPVRGRRCEHIEAFDRRSYLEFNALMEKDRWSKLSKRWKCPFCSAHIGRDDLVEASDMKALLLQAELEDSDASHAIVLPDGSLALPPPGASRPSTANVTGLWTADSDSEDAASCESAETVGDEPEEPECSQPAPGRPAPAAKLPETAGPRRDLSFLFKKDGLKQANILSYCKSSAKPKPGLKPAPKRRRR